MTAESQLHNFLDHVASDRGGTVTTFRPISGGYSRISAQATVRWADGSEESFVLRSDPPPVNSLQCSCRLQNGSSPSTHKPQTGPRRPSGLHASSSAIGCRQPLR